MVLRFQDLCLELLRFWADRGCVIEVEEIAIALIEIGLCLGRRRRDLVGVSAEVVE